MFSISMINCGASNCTEVGMSLNGVKGANLVGNVISNTPTGIELSDCSGEINVKGNKGNNVKTLVRINQESISPIKTAEIKKNVKYKILFNRKIKELLNLEAQAKFLRNYEELKKIRLLKAYLRIEI